MYSQDYGGISVAEQSIVSETYDNVRAGIIDAAQSGALCCGPKSQFDHDSCY
jgi:hypothetical protein